MENAKTFLGKTRHTRPDEEIWSSAFTTSRKSDLRGRLRLGAAIVGLMEAHSVCVKTIA
ncbi:hypothetical protein CEV34_4691 [Brucella pseudogrignonensis]|uniref:Uncharacterized protein n=1 Tax=Brucella pseudogrignonensis TaxID=419475 RepID=A0A256G4J9_9HYPH|nr:hypothetical protein CEV34_4691 [Brucella pseudogrignonensis]